MAIPLGKRIAFAISGFADSLSFGSAVKFDESQIVADYLDIIEMQRARVIPSETLERDREVLYQKILRDIRKRHIKLAFKPVDPMVVSLPEEHERLYLQAVFYWCSHFIEPMPRLLEAYAQEGPDASVDSMRRAIDKITFEDSSHRTDAFFVTAIKDGIDIPTD